MPDESATFIIIGGGIAAVSCAEEVAATCPKESILIITASQLVKTVSNWQKVGRAMETFDVEEKSPHSVFSNMRNVKIIPAFCSGIDSTKKEVYVSDGRTFCYDKLCVATGGNPKMFSDSSYVIAIRDTDSVIDFQSRLKNCRRLIVVGNGGIATELVYEVQKVEVVWVVKHKSLSATFVDAGAAEFFVAALNAKPNQSDDSAPGTAKKRLKYTHAHAGDPFENTANSDKPSVKGSALGPDWIEDLTIVGAAEKNRITVEYEACVDSILTPSEVLQKNLKAEDGENDDWPVYALLSNGKLYGCDLIVSATGVTPNTTVFVDDKNSFRIAADGGLFIDDEMRTSLPNIYAAGDVCSAGWPLALHWIQMRLWTQARQMGSYAGRCMASHLVDPGTRVELDICFEIFGHVTKFFGFKVILLGLFNGQKFGLDYEALLRVNKGEEYVKIVVKDNRIHGAILVGETDLEETVENLILNGIDIAEIKDDFLNPTVDIEDYFD